MDLNTLIPILDSVSKIAETLPFHWVAMAGIALAALVVALRKYQAFKAQTPLAEVVQLPATHAKDMPSDPKAAAALEESIKNVLK